MQTNSQKREFLLSQVASLVLHSLLDSDVVDRERKRRQCIMVWMDEITMECLGTRSYSMGALLSHVSILLLPTELPALMSAEQLKEEQQVEICMFLDPREGSKGGSWFLHVYEALSYSSYSLGRNDTDRTTYKEFLNTAIEGISYFPKESRLEAMVDNIVVKMIPNDVSSLVFALMLKELDLAVGSDSLIKRSILLIKAWCFFEAPDLVKLRDKRGEREKEVSEGYLIVIL
jgi:hypothetical protein